MKVNRKYSIVAWLIILSGIIAILAGYPFIAQRANQEALENKETNLEYNMFEETKQLSYSIYLEHMERLNKETPLYQTIVGEEEISKEVVGDIQSLIAQSKDYILEKNSHMDYAVESSYGITYSNDEEKELSELKNMEHSDQYDWYYVIQIDENGLMKVLQNQTDIGNSVIINRQTDRLLNPIYFAYHTEDGTYVQTKPVHDITMTFAVKDSDAYMNEEVHMNSYTDIYYGNNSVFYVLMVLSVVVLLACIFPYNKAKEIYGYRMFLSIPFELWIVYGSFQALAIAASGFLIQELDLNTGILLGEFNTDFDIIAYSMINIAVWIYTVTGTFFEVLILKSWYKEGIWNYLKRHSICIAAIYFIARKGHQLIDILTNFDFEDKKDRKILKCIFINYIVLCIISTFWVAGWFILFLYSCALFYIAKKFTTKVRQDYMRFKSLTVDMAKGNLDSDMNQDLGIFTPLSEDMKEIQKGFKEAVEKEVHSQRMKSELITNVSHDLKTPLTSIIAYIDLLKKENLDEEERASYLQTLERNAQRLKRLIKDLFEISKANSGNVELNKMEIDVVSLMKQVEMECNDMLSARKLDIRNSFSKDKIVIMLDPEKTYRIFENLIVNICKYALESTRVYVEMVEQEDQVEIVLKNISATELNFDTEEIMERFTRGDVSRNSEGSGLGLSIANSFAQIQGGDLHIEIDGDLFKAILVFHK